MAELTSKQKCAFRAQAHKLRPVVMIGTNGLNENVANEIERALLDHELIKIKISGADREQRAQLIQQICGQHQAHLIQTIGHIAVIYRQNPKN